MTRGTRAIVTGRLRQRSYETKEGEKRTVYELEADEVGRVPEERHGEGHEGHPHQRGRGSGQPPGQRPGRGPVGQRQARRLQRRTAFLGRARERPLWPRRPGRAFLALLVAYPLPPRFPFVPATSRHALKSRALASAVAAVSARVACTWASADAPSPSLVSSGAARPRSEFLGLAVMLRSCHCPASVSGLARSLPPGQLCLLVTIMGPRSTHRTRTGPSLIHYITFISLPTLA